MTTLDFHKDIDDSIHPDKVRIAQNILGRHFDIISYEQVDVQKNMKHDDVHFVTRDGKHHHCDLKHYSPGTWASNIFLEVFSDIDYSNGWTFHLKDNKVDYVLFIWHGKAKLCYLLVDAIFLEEWFRKHYMNYDLRKNKISVDIETGNSWQSAFIIVPIKDLSKEQIIYWQKFNDLDDFIVRQKKLG